MPLYNKKPLERCELPANIKPTDKVYYLEASNEAFTSYDGLFERTIQLNSTNWSCEYTGKTGLTFFEATDSEKGAVSALENFPSYLETPILFLVHKYTCRGRFDDLLNDILNFMKDRYFIGEHCFLAGEGKRQECVIERVDLHEEKPVSPSKGKKTPAKRGEPSLPAAHLFRYHVRLAGGKEEVKGDVEPRMLSRNKTTSSRQKLRIFLKNSCYAALESERFVPKDRLVACLSLESRVWEETFGGPEPIFPATPMQQRGRPTQTPRTATEKREANKVDQDSWKENAEDGVAATPKRSKGGREKKEVKREEETTTPNCSPSKKRPMSEKKRNEIANQQAELAITFESARRLGVEGVERWQQEDRILTKKDIDTLKEEMKTCRDKQREESRAKKAHNLERAKEWKRPRDDLDCDDLKPLPSFPALPLPSWLPLDQLSRCLTLQHFFISFQEMLPIKEIRGTSRVSLSDVVIAVRSNDPQRSSFADLMKILMQARTERADEEDGDEANLLNSAEIHQQDPNCNLDNRMHGERVREMNFLHQAVRQTYGNSVRHLPLDWLTMSEVIRLMLHTSTYYTGVPTHRHRLFQRGALNCFDDAAYQFRMDHPETVAKLETKTVFDLEPWERLSLLEVVVQQLLSFAKFRNFQDDRLAELIDLRRDLRKSKNWDEQQEKEAREARLAREFEEEQKTDNEDYKPAVRPKPSKETARLKMFLKAIKENRRYERSELKELVLAGIAWPELELWEMPLARDEQKAHFKEGETEVMDRIADLNALAGPLHLGHDRAFRSYFILESIPAVLVEEGGEGEVGQCNGETPMAEEHWEGVVACSGDMSTCSVHGPKRTERPKWSYIEGDEAVAELVSALNPRGLRELDLAENLAFHRHRIDEIANKTAKRAASGALAQLMMCGVDDPGLQQCSIVWKNEVRELMLDMEEKMEQGLLGRLPESIDRQEWRKRMKESGDITGLIGEEMKIRVRFRDNDFEPGYGVDEMAGLGQCEKLGVALLQLYQQIPLKFFKAPFMGPSSHHHGVIVGKNEMTMWQRSVLKVRSESALALHLYILEAHLQWDKTRLQGKCAGCRKKGSAEELVLCRECNDCYHLECAKPKLSPPAPTDWQCAECTREQKRIAAAEKREAEREAAAEAARNGDGSGSGSREASEGVEDMDVVRTTSGRMVKKVKYKESEIAVPLTAGGGAGRQSIGGGGGSAKKRSKKERSAEKENTASCESEEDEEEEGSGWGDCTGSEDGVGGGGETKRRGRKRKVDEMQAALNRSSISAREQDGKERERITRCEKEVRAAMRVDDMSWPFLEPVDPKEVVDYYDVIRQPMDLRTMINKIKQRTYDSADELRRDAQLVIDNARSYNQEGSEVYECADQLEKWLIPRLDAIVDEKSEKRRR